MNTNELGFESRVQSAARALPYPPTPDLAARVRQQPLVDGDEVSPFSPHRPDFPTRLAQIAAALLIGLTLLFALVPEIRAGVLEFFRVGVISIFVQQTPTASPAAATPLSSLDLPGETTLDAARQTFGYPILLPAHPADLGMPAHIYTFNHMIMLVWLDDAGQNRLNLFMLPTSAHGQKFIPFNPLETDVNGARAVWLTDAHDVEIFIEGEDDSLRHTVTGNVLIWQRGELTYRLETDLALDEAVRIAESLR